MQQRQSYAEGITRYPLSFFGHHVQGFLVVVALVFAPEVWHPVAWLMAGTYVAYQWLTQKRKNDSAGLDVLDFMVGAGIAIAACVLFDVSKAHAEGCVYVQEGADADYPLCGSTVETEPARGETQDDHTHDVDLPAHEHDTSHEHDWPETIQGEPGRPGRDGMDAHALPDWSALSAAMAAIPPTIGKLGAGAGVASIGGANALALGLSGGRARLHWTLRAATTGRESAVAAGVGWELQ